MKKIELSQGKFALVDDADYEWLNQWKWYCSRNGYAIRNVANPSATGQFSLGMHCLILETPKGMHSDHINHNPLDNQRKNLRVCTPQKNQRNRLAKRGCSSKFKGVSWHNGTGKWQAGICINKGKMKYLGLFEKEEAAAREYDKYAKSFFGDFVSLNFTDAS